MKRPRKRARRGGEYTPTRVTIPIQLGIVNAEISASPWDRHMLMIKLPPECNGKIVLPRTLFSADFNAKIAKAYGT